jgi:hypothetical protein
VQILALDMKLSFSFTLAFIVSFIGTVQSLFCQQHRVLQYATRHVRSFSGMPVAVERKPVPLRRILIAAGAKGQSDIDIVDKLNAEADQFAIAGGLMDAEEEEPIEKAVRDTNWSGQSTMEEVTRSQSNWNDLLTRKGLAVVDMMALLAFAAVGRSSHNEGFNIVADITTAAPFVASWLLLSPFLGTYTRAATASYKSVAGRLLPGWAVCMPVGLTVRGLSRGAVPPVPFVVVSLIATYLALLLGRCAYVLLAGSTSEEEQRSAGLLELLPMVSTLMRRW